MPAPTPTPAPGLNGDVKTILANGFDLIIGGYFTDAGGNADADYLVRWSGSSWSTFGTVLNGGVNALAKNGTDLYVGGVFTDVDGNPAADRIARWEGSTWTWYPLGTGLNADVNTIALNGDDVLVGGRFTDVGGNLDTDYIARWDGHAWQPFGTVWSYVETIAVNGTDLFVGLSHGTIPLGSLELGYRLPWYIARWNGSAWQPLGSGFQHKVYAIVATGSDVWVGGSQAEGLDQQDLMSIARWNGATFQPLMDARPDLQGLNDTVYALGTDGSVVYAGGTFRNAAGNPNASTIARWDGNQWQPIGTGLNGLVLTIAVSGSDVYVGGTFTDAGGNPDADRIARWDGTTWQALGTGLNNTVSAIVVQGNEVYAGGHFTESGNVPAKYIARWDGLAWHALGAGPDQAVNALVIKGSTLYAAGIFSSAGGVSTGHIACWDGASWSALGSGIALGEVKTLAFYGDELWAGGTFLNAGGIDVLDYLARWSGSAWSAVGSGSGGAVYALAVKDAQVYVGGELFDAGGSKLVRWDGGNWHKIGSPNGSVQALTILGADVYVGGTFDRINTIPSSKIGRYTDAALPIAMISAAGTVRAQEATLHWTTVNVHNNDWFVIEEQVAQGWKVVGEVQGNEPTNESRSYTFVVPQLAFGAHVFRIAQHDRNGNITYSPCISVDIEMPSSYALSAAYPNPFNRITTFTLAVARTQPITITVSDLMGRQMRTLYEDVLPENETRTFRFDATGLSSGTYLIRVKGRYFAGTQTVLLKH